MKKKKFKLIIWPIIYTVLIICVCISAGMVFHSYYYTSIYVSGSSMSPTLNMDNPNPDGMVDYGIVDAHDYAIDHVAKDKLRFKIITTHYPFSNGGQSDYENGYVHGGDNVLSSNASYKIKRIYAFPGESFKFTDYTDPETGERKIDFYVQTGFTMSWDNIKPVTIPFERKYKYSSKSYNYEHNQPLGSDEFWVMGDNYEVSYDSFFVKLPIYRDNIVGVLIAIEGRCKISKTTSNDGTPISATCTNRQRYGWPRFF